MESQPQNPEFWNSPENFHPWRHYSKTLIVQTDSSNKGADQPARMCSLISAFVILFLENIISKLASSDFF